MKKLLWIVGTFIAYVLWVFLVGFIAVGANIVESIVTHSEIRSVDTSSLGSFMLLGCAVLTILSILMWKRWNAKCHACKRWGAMEATKTELLKQEEISVLVEMKHRNLNREVTGTQEQYIPGKRKTYQDIYKCKYCSNLETRTRIEDRASV